MRSSAISLQSTPYWVRSRNILQCAVLVCSGVLWVQGSVQAASNPPPYLTTRYDEDYRYLEDPARRSGILDEVKYLPLNANGSWYGSLGGEIRERYEYYDHWNWGLGPQDPNGFWLQRILFSADVHYEESFRVFGQLMSALEDGRTSGPRLTDEDVLDLHQGFVDGRLALGNGGKCKRPTG